MITLPSIRFTSQVCNMQDNEDTTEIPWDSTVLLYHTQQRVQIGGTGVATPYPLFN